MGGDSRVIEAILQDLAVPAMFHHHDTTDLEGFI